MGTSTQTPLRSPDVPNRYHDFKGSSEYETSRNILILPIAGPEGTPPAVVYMSTPLVFRTMSVAGSKFGAPPVMPALCDTQDSQGYLTGWYLGSELNFYQPQITADQANFEYATTGRYRYIMNPERISGSGSNLIGQPNTGQAPFAESPTYPTATYPYPMEIINAAQVGISGVLAGAAGLNILSPDYFTYSTDFQGAFFSVQTAK